MDIIYRYDPYAAVAVNAPADAAEAVERLRAGNGRFADIAHKMQQHTMGELQQEMVIPISPVSLGLPLWPGGQLDQAPFALFLGCADARVPVELILDQSVNDLFVIRVAGNVLGVECLGSVDYAVRSFRESLKVVVVLGHSGCGAVSAAVSSYLDPNDYSQVTFTHSLRSLVDRIMLAVRGAAKALAQVTDGAAAARPGFRKALVETAVYLNAAITAFDLRREVESLGERTKVVYGVYDLHSMRIHNQPERAPPTGSPNLSFWEPPSSGEELTALSLRIAENAVAAGLLD